MVSWLGPGRRGGEVEIVEVGGEFHVRAAPSVGVVRARVAFGLGEGKEVLAGDGDELGDPVDDGAVGAPVVTECGVRQTFQMLLALQTEEGFRFPPP